MDYIEQVRRHIGHDLLLTLGCGAVVEDAAGRLLLLRRADNGLWAVPGGLLEPGEFVLDTMRREVREETGLDVEARGLFGVYSGPEGYSGYPNGDQVFSVMVILRAKAAAARLQPDEESLAQAFFARDAFPALDTVWRTSAASWPTG